MSDIGPDPEIARFVSVLRETNFDWTPRTNGDAGDWPDEPTRMTLNVVTLHEFAATDEEGADALLGDDDESAVIAAGSDAMFYGDGGAGKTTLVVDLACHLAAGDAWLGVNVARKLRVLVIENEGPRPLFRKKLRRKLEAWQGSPIEDRLLVLEEPWAALTLADELHRETLAGKLRELEVDVVLIGPVTASGMLEAGTIQQVREFAELVKDVRRRSGRPVTFVLVHHENKGGKVSGAWEGVGDSLIHVQAQGHGKTRVFFEKLRWGSKLHKTSLQLRWTDGEGFEVAEELERTDDTIADEMRAAVLANGGASWNVIEKSVTGKGEKKRAIRDRLLAGDLLVNAGGAGGMKLWHPDDPALPEQLRPGRDAHGTQVLEGW
jgi:hypothetical protein